MLSYTLEKIPIAMSMAVSLIASIKRNANKVALFHVKRRSLDVINRQRKACLLVLFIKRARGVRLLSVFVEATCLIS